MIIALLPGRVIPVVTGVKFNQALGPEGRTPDQPNVWSGMRVLMLDIPARSSSQLRRSGQRPRATCLWPAATTACWRSCAQPLAPLDEQVTLLDGAASAGLPLPDQSIDRAFIAVQRGGLSPSAHTLHELQRVVKPGGQLVVMAPVAAGSQQRSRIVRASAVAGFEQVASYRRRLQRIMVFRLSNEAGAGQLDAQ
jgi:hypothetical protein